MCLNITCKQACSTSNKWYESSGSSRPMLGVTTSLVEMCIECQSFLANRDLSSQVSSSRSSNDWYLVLVFSLPRFLSCWLPWALIWTVWEFGLFFLPELWTIFALTSYIYMLSHNSLAPQTPKSKLSGCLRQFSTQQFSSWSDFPLPLQNKAQKYKGLNHRMSNKIRKNISNA